MIPFYKYEGLGNDFLIVDEADLEGAWVRPRDAVAWCARRVGVGADGVLLIERGRRTRFAMRVLNADGTTAEMCGNGLRCVGRYLSERYGRGSTLVETGAGPLAVEVMGDQVRVAMGPGRSRGREALLVGTERLEGHALDLGNPHYVQFGDWSEARFRHLGPAVSGHARFPAGTNASFATLEAPDHIRLRVWERGAGPTQACGTGACATVAAAWLDGRTTAAEIAVDLPGGRLWVSGTPAALQMSGPARRVYEGRVALAEEEATVGP